MSGKTWYGVRPACSDPQPLSEWRLDERSIHDALAFVLDSTVDLPDYADGKQTGYDRDTLLMRLESFVITRETALTEKLATHQPELIQRLVDALEQTLPHVHDEYCCGCPPWPHPCPEADALIAEARAAIAKAEGKP